MNESLFPVILAGGSGTRLWPLSRRARPKPLHAPLGGEPLLREAWRRATLLAPPDNVLLAVEARLAEEIRALLPELPAGNLLLEPRPRDTGPAAVRAAWHVTRRQPGALMALLPADHRMDDGGFVEAMEAAQAVVAQHDALVCLGVPPSTPSSAYGYLQTSERPPLPGAAAPIARFLEKPEPARAAELCRDGRVLWNAGIFVWSAARFLDEVEAVSPDLEVAARVLRESGDVEGFFAAAPPISVDRAVLERTRRAWVVATCMGWDDLGEWEAVARHLPLDEQNNAASGRLVAVEARDNVVYARKPVVLFGADRLVVVEGDDVFLVAERDAAGRLRDLPRILAERGMEDLT